MSFVLMMIYYLFFVIKGVPSSDAAMRGCNGTGDDGDAWGGWWWGRLSLGYGLSGVDPSLPAGVVRPVPLQLKNRTIAVANQSRFFLGHLACLPRTIFLRDTHGFAISACALYELRFVNVELSCFSQSGVLYTPPFAIYKKNKYTPLSYESQ